MSFCCLLRSYFIQSDCANLKAAILTLSEYIPNIHADNFIMLNTNKCSQSLENTGCLFYSLKPCPNQLSLKDNTRHSEKFLSLLLLVLIPKERNICGVCCHNYNYVAAPAVAAADHSDGYVNDFNTEDDSGDNECVCS